MKHKLLTESLSFTVGMGFSALPAVAQQSPASTEVKPNVIIINVDDLGYGDIGCYGATKVKTPNICLLYTSPSPRDVEESRMPSSA